MISLIPINATLEMSNKLTSKSDRGSSTVSIRCTNGTSGVIKLESGSRFFHNVKNFDESIFFELCLFSGKSIKINEHINSIRFWEPNEDTSGFFSAALALNEDFFSDFVSDLRKGFLPSEITLDHPPMGKDNKLLVWGKGEERIWKNKSYPDAFLPVSNVSFVRNIES